MDNDLISREALKKATKRFTDSDGFNPIWQIIDNAPTVEADNIIDGLNNQINDLSENLAWYINERNKLLKERRPHGKWIKHEWGYSCSVCGMSNDYAYDNNIHKFTDYYCPNCGVDMRDDSHGQ